MRDERVAVSVGDSIEFLFERSTELGKRRAKVRNIVFQVLPPVNIFQLSFVAIISICRFSAERNNEYIGFAMTRATE